MKIEEFFEHFESSFILFLQYIANNDIAIYNEFSLQHEFGLYLRNVLNAKVEFERNIHYFGIFYDEKDLEKIKLAEKGYTACGLKHEIDIVVYQGKPFTDNFVAYAIELKYPSIKQVMNLKTLQIDKKSNGAFPAQMFSFVKDIKFMEVLAHKAFFKKTFCVTLVDTDGVLQNKEFFGGNGVKKYGIYSYFHQCNKPLTGVIPKPYEVNNDKKAIYLKEKYFIKWNSWLNEDEEKGKYYILSFPEKRDE